MNHPSTIQEEDSKKSDHIPQLDGVRAIAISLVLIFHWFPQNSFINRIPNGTIGVTLFFVLSGFLITNILLKNRISSKKKINIYKIFLIRRALRIFPIYFLVLFIVSILPYMHPTTKIVTDYYTNPIYYWTYFYNHLLEKTNNWEDILSPFWTLAVEEQFYVFWAIIILLIPKHKQIEYFLWITIVFGIIARYFFIYLNHGLGLLTITCIDTFAWGGILAFYGLNNTTKRLPKIIYFFIPISLLLFFYIIFRANNDSNLIKILFFRSSVSCLSIVFISFLINNNKHILSKILMFYPIRFIGKISYGIYVYHMFVPILFGIILNKLKIHLPYQNQCINLIVLLIFSYCSWIFFEEPLNKLKKHFNY